nr:hypothetical protein [Escherichia coli]
MSICNNTSQRSEYSIGLLSGCVRNKTENLFMPRALFFPEDKPH